MAKWDVDHLKEFTDMKLHYADELRKSDDRRYAEVNIEKEKALKIKEAGDAKALDLAREIQIYKDEKANELREQINQERNLYVRTDKMEEMMKPVNEYINGQRGRSKGLSDYYGWILAAISAAINVVLFWRG